MVELQPVAKAGDEAFGMVYEPDRMLAVALTVLIALIAMAVLFTILFFVLVGIVRLFEVTSSAIRGAFQRLGLGRRSHSA